MSSENKIVPEVAYTANGSKLHSYKSLAKYFIDNPKQWELEAYEPHVREFKKFSEELFPDEDDCFAYRIQELIDAKNIDPPSKRNNFPGRIT